MNNKWASVLKIAVAVASLAFIGWKVYAQLADGEPFASFSPTVAPLLAAVLLMPLNWLLETRKWQVLTSDLQTLTIKESFRSVLAGLAVSMLTPNRVGDFAGRIVWLKPENRTAGTMSAFVGGWAQMLAIALLGVVAFCMKPVLPDFLEWFGCHAVATAAVLIVLAAVVCVAYVFMGSLASRFRFSRWQWLEKFVRAAGQHTKWQLAVVLFLSLCRTVVFIIQFQLILQSSEINLETIDAFRSIALMYCFVSVIPTFALAEWGVRGSMALLFVTPLGGSPTQIVAATLALWLINVALPAIVGALLMAFSKKRLQKD